VECSKARDNTLIRLSAGTLVTCKLKHAVLVSAHSSMIGHLDSATHTDSYYGFAEKEYNPVLPLSNKLMCVSICSGYSAVQAFDQITSGHPPSS
jgi:hypothetical protein